MRATYRILVTAVGLALAACPNPAENVQCEQDTNCDLSSGGRCVATTNGHQWCAYPDPECPSGYSYSEQGVGDDLGGTCTAGSDLTAELMVMTGGNGAGSVSSVPEGLECVGSVCTGEFPVGTQIELTPEPTTGVFLGWSESCSGSTSCVVTMDTDHRVGALFGTPGQSLWASQVGAGGRDAGKAIAVDTDGNIVTVGEFSGSVQIGATALTSAGGTDIYVAKLAGATGDVIWAKRFGGTSDDVSTGVAVHGVAELYVTGSFQGSVNFGGGALASAGQRDGFVLKLGGSGDHVWSRRFGGGTSDIGYAITADASGAAVVGFFTGAITVEGVPLANAGSADIIAAKYAAAGTLAWAKSFGGTDNDIAYGVAIDGTSNVVVIGKFEGNVNFGGTALSSRLADVFVLKVAAASGAHLFSKGFGSDQNDYGYAVAVDSADNIYIAGSFAGPIDFGGGSFPSDLDGNFFLTKLTLAGGHVWSKPFSDTGSASIGTATSIDINANGDVALAGLFCGTISFGGSRTLSAAGACDAYATRLSGADGAHLNSARMGGTATEYGSGVAHAADGRFFVTGSFGGLGEFGGKALTSAGGDDSFIVALAPL
ncbi:MAG: SBBP repeat-containing protein [Kofleriaceae bacterium]